MIEQLYKELIMNVQHVLPCTPRSVVYFMAGSLPGIGLLHLRQLGAFGMICRLPGNILNLHAVNIFTFATSKSWFLNIRDVCLQYKLPNPLELLKAPLPKEKYKNLIKKHVVDYWEQERRSEASVCDSLTSTMDNCRLFPC